MYKNLSRERVLNRNQKSTNSQKKLLKTTLILKASVCDKAPLRAIRQVEWPTIVICSELKVFSKMWHFSELKLGESWQTRTVIPKASSKSCNSTCNISWTRGLKTEAIYIAWLKSQDQKQTVHNFFLKTFSKKEKYFKPTNNFTACFSKLIKTK